MEDRKLKSCRLGLPEGVKPTGFTFDHEKQQWILFVSHESFDVVPEGAEIPEMNRDDWKDRRYGESPLAAAMTRPPLYNIYVSNPEQVKANIDAWKAGKTALKLEAGVCYEDVFPYPANHVVVDANEAKRQLLEENKVLAGYGGTKILVDNFTAGSLPLEDGEVAIKMDIVSKPGVVQQIHRSGTVAYHGFEIPASELATVASEPPKECTCSGNQLLFGECNCGWKAAQK